MRRLCPITTYGSPGRAAPDHVDTGRNEMRLVPNGRKTQGQVRIVGQDGLSRGAPLAAHHPVVARGSPAFRQEWSEAGGKEAELARVSEGKGPGLLEGRRGREGDGLPPHLSRKGDLWGPRKEQREARAAGLLGEPQRQELVPDVQGEIPSQEDSGSRAVPTIQGLEGVPGEGELDREDVRVGAGVGVHPGSEGIEVPASLG